MIISKLFYKADKFSYGLLLFSGLICLFLACSPGPTDERISSYDLRTAIIRVAKQNIPAVAYIEAIKQEEVENPFAPFERAPFLRRFFNTPPLPKKFRRQLRGLGTGMIIDTEGHILTSSHVVRDATIIEVSLADGRRYSAVPVGSDPKTDLAVIKIADKQPLPHVRFGDSDNVMVGQWVAAIGHPRGLDQTVTKGIISAKRRQRISVLGGYRDFLQTNAAMNPGNSGGPLLNMRGEVIGVNTSIASTFGGFEGISFTIPGNTARRVAKDLIAHRKVESVWQSIKKLLDRIWDWLMPPR